MESKKAKLNTETEILVDFRGSVTGDAINYVIVKVSTGVVEDSGLMTFIAGESWKVLFTPTVLENFLLTATYVDIDITKSVNIIVETAVTPTASRPKTFTTWAALLETLKNDLANYKPGIHKYKVADREVEYSTFQQLQDQYDWVESKANIEAGTSRVRRTVARTVGGHY